MISLGDHVRVGWGAHFLTHDGGVWVLRDLKEDYKNIDLFGKITVGNNVHISPNATIMPGITIGNNCIIGFGAIVTKNIPDNSIAVGIPAKVIGTVDEYAKKHENDFIQTKHLSPTEKREMLEKLYNSDSHSH